MGRVFTARKLSAGITLALAAGALTSSSASANFVMFDLPPHVPGIGNPAGVAGPAPEVGVTGGPVELVRGRYVPVAVSCSTSTEAGCSGAVQLYSKSGDVLGSAPFALTEDEAQVAYVKVPSHARARATRQGGLRAAVLASGEDSLGRVGSATTKLTVRG